MDWINRLQLQAQLREKKGSRVKRKKNDNDDNVLWKYTRIRSTKDNNHIENGQVSFFFFFELSCFFRVCVQNLNLLFEEYTREMMIKT